MHIDIMYFYLQGLIEKGNSNIQLCLPEITIADFFPYLLYGALYFEAWKTFDLLTKLVKFGVTPYWRTRLQFTRKNHFCLLKLFVFKKYQMIFDS